VDFGGRRVCGRRAGFHRAVHFHARDGRSLGDLIKAELGEIPGMIALLGCFMIMVIILAVLALIVVKALTGSPWGTSP